MMKRQGRFRPVKDIQRRSEVANRQHILSDPERWLALVAPRHQPALVSARVDYRELQSVMALTKTLRDEGTCRLSRFTLGHRLDQNSSRRAHVSTVEIYARSSP